MKKLALVGYGKMGHVLESLAPEAGFEVVLRLDVDNNAHGEAFTAGNFAGIDVAIEFTAPDVAVDNLLALARLSVPTVCGTTGWFERTGEVAAAYNETGAPLVYSPNYSIGVNIFQRVVAEAARLMSRQPAYEAWAWEIHHSQKKDAPSGTLLKLVDEMRAAGYAGHVDIGSNRAGKVPGTHEIGFDSSADTITLRHIARSREGLARGALWAANWVQGKHGVHEFSRILFEESKE
ncbi:MAG TPA: dihydrodipicolinate reductase C-terminal domain-containing protein [Bryobacteraceae bacterium]|nr:dihydrodipicolinate reductase C-terminal domain-containing protein [Bryobacteraceae bacterium]